MVKNYFLKMFAGIAFLGLLASCNTTQDPTESKPNPDDGPAIPKILAKVMMDTSLYEEYISTNKGVLEQTLFKDEKAVNTYYTGTLTYTDDPGDNTKKNITKVKFVSPAAGSLSYSFDIVPGEKGRISSASCIATGATPGLSHLSDYAFTYDATEKLTKILEKRKEGGISAYNKFIEYTFVYSGDNIFQAVCKKGILDITGAPEMTTAVKTTYSFQNYDSKKSAFSLLPKNYFIVRSLMDPANFYKMSPNNPTSMYFDMPPPTPSVNTGQSYSYDNQGYPMTEKNQKFTFTYKNL
ncbi:hypothetical protein [Chryseobacterium sp. SIMBA_028]|uniref:hypothetical protein n=1 Tax=Chryseobacterium sp. SIMBA_028 TaxID=3085771 RepID=UPI0039781EC5